MSTLAVLPSLRVARRPDGKLVLTTKFIDGMLDCCRNSDGDLRLLMEPSQELSVNLGREVGDPTMSPPRGRPGDPARVIVPLASEPARLAEVTRHALRFASDHDFEQTFRRRIGHRRALATG